MLFRSGDRLLLLVPFDEVPENEPEIEADEDAGDGVPLVFPGGGYECKEISLALCSKSFLLGLAA